MKAKEQNNAPLIVCDPRFTRTAAHADEYVHSDLDGRGILGHFVAYFRKRLGR